MRRALVIVAVACLAWPVSMTNAQATDDRCFAETGHCINGRIRQEWEADGGVPILGLPLGPQRNDTQWFERARVELQANDLSFGALGVERLQLDNREWKSFPTGQRKDGCMFFDATRHSLCEPFLSYWQTHGGARLFGMPISEPGPDRLVSPDVGVQWFEQARFELRNGQVQLGTLGSDLYPRQPPTFVSGIPPAPAGNQGTGGGASLQTAPPAPVVGFAPSNVPLPPAAKAALQVSNKSGGIARLALAGPTNADWPLADGQVFQPSVEPGAYKASVTTSCGGFEKVFNLDPGQTGNITLSCDPSTNSTGELKITNATGGSLKISVVGPISKDWIIAPDQQLDESLLPGDYQISETATCGSKTDTFSLQVNDLQALNLDCVALKPPPSATLRIHNDTPSVARFSIVGPSSTGLSIAAGGSRDISALPGDYEVSVEATCGALTESVSVADGDVWEDDVTCDKIAGPPPPAMGTIGISNGTGGPLSVSVSGPTSDTWSVANGQSDEHSLPVGDYTITVQARCGVSSGTASVSTQATPELSFECR